MHILGVAGPRGLELSRRGEESVLDWTKSLRDATEM